MDIGWKIVSAGAGVVSGVIANKGVDVIWKKLVGKANKPAAHDPNEPIRDALVFAVVSAAVGAVVNELVLRKAANWYGLNKVIEQAKDAIA